jgi:cytoskeletal protein CcmA (bactofilin family)
MIKFKDSSRAEEALSHQYSSLERNSLITGDVKSVSDFRIDGIIYGDIKTTGKIIIGKNGHLLGKAECLNAEISGHFNGELKVTGMLTLRKTAVVEGKIYLNKISVEPGAVFNASVNMEGFVPQRQESELAVSHFY